MADLESLNLQIRGTNTSAVKSIDSTVASLGRLQKALGSVGNSTNLNGLKSMASSITRLSESLRTLSKTDAAGLTNVSRNLKSLKHTVDSLGSINKSNFKSLTASIKSLNTAVSGLDGSQIAKLRDLGAALRELKSVEGIRLSGITNGITAVSSAGRSSGSSFNLLKSALNGVQSGLRTVSSLMSKFASLTRSAIGAAVSAFKSLRKTIDLGSTAIGQFLKKFASRAISMAMRSIIKAITTAFKEGLESLYHYSSEVKKDMDALTTSISGLKAAAGSSLYSVLSAISGVLQTIISYATIALNAISQLFSAFGGKTTYYAGLTKDAEAYTGSAKKATGATKKLQQSLMGFDEINKLTDNSSGGGGGGAAKKAEDYAGTFAKEAISEPLLRAVQTMNFTEIGQIIGDKINKMLSSIPWDEVREKMMGYANAMSTLINGLFSEVDPELMGQSLANLLDSAISAIDHYWYNTDWKKIGAWLRETLRKAFDSLDASEVGAFIVRKLHAALEFVSGFLTEDIGWSNIVNAVEECIRGMIGAMSDIDMVGLGQKIVDGIVGAINAVGTILRGSAFRDMWSNIIETLKGVLQKVPDLAGSFVNLVGALWDTFKFTVSEIFGGNDLGDTFSNVGSMLYDGIVAAVTTVVDWVKSGGLNDIMTMLWGLLTGAFKKIPNIWRTFGNFLSQPEQIAPKLKEVGKKLFESVRRSISAYFTQERVEEFRGKILGFVHDVPNWLLSALTGLMKTAFGGSDLSESFEIMKNRISTGVRNALSNVADYVSSEQFKSLVSNIWEKIKTFFGKIPDMASSAWAGAKKIYNSLKDSLKAYFTDERVSSAVNTIWSKVKEWVGKIPSVATSFGRFASQALKDFGIRIKSFFNSEKVQKVIDVMWKSIQDGIKLIPSVANVFARFALSALRWLRRSIVSIFTLEAVQRALNGVWTTIKTAFQQIPSFYDAFQILATGVRDDMVSAITDKFGAENWQSLIGYNVGEWFGNFSIADIAINVAEISILGITAWKLGSKILAAIKAAIVTFFGASATAIGGFFGSAINIGGLVFALEAIKIALDIGENAENGVSMEDFSAFLSAALKSVGFLLLKVDPLAGTIVLGISVIIDVLSFMWRTRDTKAEAIREAFQESGQDVVELTVDITSNVSSFTEVNDDVQSVVDHFNELTGLNYDSIHIVDMLRDFGLVARDVEPDAQTMSDALMTLFDVSEWMKWGNGIESVGAHLRSIGEICGMSEEDVNTMISTMLRLDNLDITSEAEVDVNTSGAEDSIQALKDSTSDASDILQDAQTDIQDLSTSLGTTNDSIGSTNNAITRLQRKYGANPKQLTTRVSLSNYNTVIQQLNNISKIISSINQGGGVTVNANTSSNGSGFFGRTTDVQAFASGGYISAGDLFVMNEKEPEILGQINGRSAVANQMEIGDAIFRYMDSHDSRSGSGLTADAIATAVVSACKSAGLGAVYLDGKQLSQSIRKESKRIGHSAI